jgi:U3 small nucleolar RNA-associated protein 4
MALVETSGNFTICLRYGNMLFMDFIADNEMIVVEQPWMDIVNALPDSVERRVYVA